MMHQSNHLTMLGGVVYQMSGCRCCSHWRHDPAVTRTTKRQERHNWKKEAQMGTEWWIDQRAEEAYMQQQAEDEYELAYEEWANDRLADDYPASECTKEAYDDYLTDLAEQRAEEMTWAQGCGPR